MKKNLITIAILLTSPSLALAEEQPAEQLQPINVYSAYAAPVNQDKTASSVTVLTEKEFSARNATYVSDVLKTVPSVTMSASGGRGTLTNFYLRGADANHTAVIIDGVKMNPVSGYGFDFGGLSLSNIERIEVLRGEQSALWGSDAMGGVIYITTKSGLYKDKAFNVDFDLGLGSRNTRDASATVSGYKDGFYYALQGDSHRTRGISAMSSHTFRYTGNDGSHITSGGATENDRFHRDNGALRFGYADDNKGAEFLATHSSQTGRYDDSIATENDFDDRTRTRDTLFKLSGFWGNDQQLFKHQLGVSHLKTDSDTYSIWSNSAYDGKKLNANYQLDVNFDREGGLTQGISLLTEYQKADYDSSYFDSRASGGTLESEKKLIEKSAAMEYRLFTEEDHSLSLSGRYTNSSAFDNSLTGRISGAYRFSPNFRVHAGFGTAVQNPSINEYYGYNGSYVGNPNLKPERSRGGDVGLLIESGDKKHSADITYFGRLVDNYIGSRTENAVTYAVNEEGSTRIKGVELAYNGKIIDQLSGYANYTYTRTQRDNGSELIRRPKHMANLGLAYQITEKLGTDANISYVGKRHDTYFAPDFSSHNVKLPSYTLLNLGVNYQVTKQLNVYVNLNNLFDKKYEHTVGYGQLGRNVYVGLKGSF